MTSNDGPTQYFPRLEGVGLEQLRNRALVPPSHVTEHVVQLSHEAHDPSTEEAIHLAIEIAQELLQKNNVMYIIHHVKSFIFL